MALSPTERRLRARLAALIMHSRGSTNTRPAFEARMRRLEQQVDPGGELSPDERERRVRLALKAQMTALAFKAAKKRRGAER